MNRVGRRGPWFVQAAALLLFASVPLLVPPAANARDATNPGAISARAYQPAIGAPGAYVLVTWSRPSRVPSSYIQGYVVWRNDFFTPAQRVGGIATDSFRQFTDTEATRNFTAYDGDPGDVAGSPTTFGPVAGLSPGQRYSYQLSAAYRNGLQDRDGDGMPDDESYMSPLSVSSRLVTAIGTPVITAIDGSPAAHNTQVNLRDLALEWQQAPGANKYVIWISPEPTFRRKVAFNVPPTIPVNLGGPETVAINLNAFRGILRRTTRAFITIGAKNSAEPAPRPRGWIFSAPVQVEVEIGPPDPP